MSIKCFSKFDKIILSSLFTTVFTTSSLIAESSQPGFKIFGKTVSMDEIKKQEQDQFYQIEKEKYKLIENLARKAYLDSYWEQLAKKNKTTSEKAQEDYFKTNVKVTDSEVTSTLEKYKDHPQIKDLSKEEQVSKIQDLLSMRAEQELVQAILEKGEAANEFAVLYPKPKEPVYEMKVVSEDQIRFGPNDQDTKPLKGGCKGDDCLITVVEYSDYKCPFCLRVVDTTKKVMDTYKGKIRWIVRDFPLNFHERARPAAVAAKCASFQNKYWEMYHHLFKNQQNLDDESLFKYAKALDLDESKFKACYANDKDIQKSIDENIQVGMKAGVTGTPAFFINGRRLSGALPYSEFSKVIQEELDKKKGPAKTKG